MMGKGCERVFAISSTHAGCYTPVRSIPPGIEEREAVDIHPPVEVRVRFPLEGE